MSGGVVGPEQGDSCPGGGESYMVRSKLNMVGSLYSEIQYIIENGPMGSSVNTQNDRQTDTTKNIILGE